MTKVTGGLNWGSERVIPLQLTEQQRQHASDLHKGATMIDASGVVRYDDGFLEEVFAGGVTATNHTVTRPPHGLREGMLEIARCRRWIRNNANRVLLAETAADIRLAKARGMYAVIMGPQNTDILEGSVEILESFHALGVRVMQLTYQRRNLVGDGCAEPADGGLSLLGRELVKAMNGLGIVIDLSHCGRRTTLEAIKLSRDPVVFSHTHPRSLTNHIRNKENDLIRSLADRGGVMGITSFAPISEIKPGVRPDILDFVRHIEYVVELVGIDHVGIGLDYSGILTAEKFAQNKEKHPEIYGDYTFETRRVQGIEKPSMMHGVTEVLVGRGFSPEAVRKILGLNFLRVFEQVWRG